MENRLIEQAGRGDRDAFSRLVEVYAGNVYRSLYRETGNEDSALDLTVTTFERAWHAIGLFQYDTSFADWIQRIADDVVQTSHKSSGNTLESPNVPENLCSVIMGSIQAEESRFHPKQMLSRMKFTLLALVIVLLLLLASKMGWLESRRTPAPASTPAPVPSQAVTLPDAEFHATP